MTRAGSRWMRAAAGVALLGAALLVDTAPVAAAPVPLGGLDVVFVYGEASSSSVSPKQARAVCPPGKVVLGGGGWVWASIPADDRYIVMTQAQPVHSSTVSGYFVTGTEVAGGLDGWWGVDAFALCGNRPAGYAVVDDPRPFSSTALKEAIAECPDGKRVLGTGARIDNSGGQVTLQTARSDGSRGIGRAVAKEDADGYAGNWSVTATTVCADPRSGFTIVYGASVATGSENVKSASVDCPSGTVIHNVGASVSGTPAGLHTAPPGVAVLDLNPEGGGRSAHAYAVESTPTDINWDLVVQVVCGP